MHSSRFPGKAIFPIDGKPMIVRTAEQAKKVSDCKVYIATDDAEITLTCLAYGYDTIQTGHHKNGTERCAEAARLLCLGDDDCVLNLQADLPYIQPDLLEKVFQFIPYYITTAAVKVKGLPDKDPNMVKVIVDRNQNALYFSRQPIPSKAANWLNHIGIYGFTNNLLQEFASRSVSVLELQEDLEQLRILYHGQRKIKVLETDKDCISVNIPSDIDKLRIYWPTDGPINGHVI
jgi:3-deoxy-manno-octulosonate cytidylyltransferase (CMP-KDO synthetase)